MSIPIINSRDIPNNWRIVDDKLGNMRERGLPFRYSYVGSFSQHLAEWFIKVYSNKGDVIFEPFCVAKDSIVLLNQQDRIKIQDIKNRKDRQTTILGERKYLDNVMCMDLDHSNDEKDREDLVKNSNIENFYVKESNDLDIFEIYTRNKRKLISSGNHHFLVKNGNNAEWKELKNIKFGDMVAVYPSINIADDSVEKEMVILDKKKLMDNMPDQTDVDYVLSQLENNGLLPLTNKNPKLHIIARLCGFLMTDGFISEGETNHKEKGKRIDTHVNFTSGSLLSGIISDIELLGLSSGIYIGDVKEKSWKDRSWGLNTRLEYSSKSLYILFKSLGVPSGKKTEQIFDVPDWIFNCSKRIKQEFLGGLLGGDGLTVTYRDMYNSSGGDDRIIPQITNGGFVQSKLLELEDHLKTYLSHIDSLIKEFDIETRILMVSKNHDREDGKETVTYRIDFSAKHENTLSFLKNIGYRYDSHKITTSYPIYEYLLSKENRIGIKKNATRGNSFPVFKKWKGTYMVNDIVFDDVISIKKIEYNEKLYDLSIEKTHNYIVNEFVTHNSGRGTVAMQALWNERHVICNDLSPFSNILCHSILWTPYMKDVKKYLKLLEDYILEGRCNASEEYAGKGSKEDIASIYHPDSFKQIIKLRNTLNSEDIMLGLGDSLFGITDNDKDRTYRHEIIMFLRMVMSQCMLNSNLDTSFNKIKIRGSDNTSIKGLLRYFQTMGQSPEYVNIFNSMKLYIDKMDLDSQGIKDKFGKLKRNLISCDARKLTLPDKCADMVLTSPPYFSVLDYGKSNWIRFWTINNIGDPLVKNVINKIDSSNSSEIHGKIYDKATDSTGSTVANPLGYSMFTGHYLRELYRILKDDSVAIIVVGDYGNKGKVDAWRIVADRATVFHFKPALVIMDKLNKDLKSSSQFNSKQGGGKNDYDVCVVLYKGKYERKNNPEDIDFRWNAKFTDNEQTDIESAWGV
jgi:intein/homing endonuclease/DNA modification methylase